MQVRATIGEVFNVQIRVALGTNLRKSKKGASRSVYDAFYFDTRMFMIISASMTSDINAHRLLKAPSIEFAS